MRKTRHVTIPALFGTSYIQSYTYPCLKTKKKEVNLQDPDKPNLREVNLCAADLSSASLSIEQLASRAPKIGGRATNGLLI